MIEYYKNLLKEFLPINNSDLCLLGGSLYYFYDIPDYKKTDVDFIIYVNSIDRKKFLLECCKKHFKELHKNKIDLFINVLPEDLDKFIITITNKHSNRFLKNSLLIKEFTGIYNVTTDILDKYFYLFETLLNKYSYLKLIKDFYIKNNNFVLTEEQKLKAFNEYKLYKQWQK